MKIQGLVVAICVALLPCLHAESFTTNVIDAITTNAGPQFTVGATGSYNVLLVTNAGQLTAGTNILGDAVGAEHNSAVVTGSNSVWRSTNSFFLGNTGSLNQVSVLDGGHLIVALSAAFGIDQNSRSNVMLVSGPGSLFNTASLLRIGLFGSDNGLIIREGGRVWTGSGVLNHPEPNFALGSGVAIIGREEGAAGNFAIVQGAGSLWNLPSLTVGRTGHGNFLHILEGAVATAFSSRVGQLGSAAGNRVLVSGLGSFWNTYNELIIGSNGPNSVVDVTDGGRLRASVITIGAASSSNQLNVLNAIATDHFPNGSGLHIGLGSNANFNVARFDGPGARGTNDRAVVGLRGASNSLVVLNGAEFTVGGALSGARFLIGERASSHGNSVEVTGIGSKLISTLTLELGEGGSGNRLLIEDAYLRTLAAQIGGTCGASNNSVLIQGPNAVWTNGPLELGFCSVDNSLTISRGAQVLAGRVTSSVQGGGRNNIDVSGAGSSLRAADLAVGGSGIADVLTVSDGGAVFGRHDRLGGAGSDTVALVTGAGSTWSNVTLVVGDSGARNSLRIDDGASVQTGEFTIGRLGNAHQNAIELIGDGTRLSISTNLNIGGLGDSNRFIVTDGARAEAHNIHLGAGSATTPASSSDLNRLSVIGSSSSVIAQGNVVSEGNSNRLEVLDGAQLHSMGVGVIGDDSGARNSVIVSGHGSAWLMTNELVVGRQAQSSSLVISNGAFVRSQSGHVGVIGGLIGEGSICIYRVSGGSVRVTGQNSLWAIAGSLVVGNGAILNSLLITNGGRVAARDAIIGVSHGGLLSRPGCEGRPGAPPFFNQIDIAGGNLDLDMSAVNTFEVRYGTLRLRSGAVNAGRLLMTNQWSRLELLGGSLTSSEAFVDNGLPLIIGDGLHNASFHGGDITAPGGIVVREHALLESSGRISAPITNFGTLSPLAFGTFAASNYYQQPAGTLLIDIALHRAELLSVSNVAVLDGNLRLRQDVGPLSNAVAIIRAGAVTGTFDNVTNGGRLKTTDNLGSYIVEYTPTSVVLRDYQSTDLDSDMIEDAWATRHFGHSPVTPAEKSADADGDGASNYEEFFAGTNPTNSTSTLRASISYANGVAAVTFPCQEGKRYRIVSGSVLAEWSSGQADWTDLIDPTFSFPAAGLCRWTEDGRGTGGLGGPARFFRVMVEFE